MAYRLPTFNITCDIYTPDVANTPGVPTTPPRRAGVLCNLAYGRRVNSAPLGVVEAVGTPGGGPQLLLPPRTDIRGPQDTVSFDVVECPPGTGRWYYVVSVEDAGRGFPNEHRVAALSAIGGTWVAPYG